ncbi:MAG: hypothetical protein ACJAXA_003436, partial [Candidatus Aldehydirespiratoraceae bacterium]
HTSSPLGPSAIGTYSLGDPLLNVQATGALVRVIARWLWLPTGTSDRAHVSVIARTHVSEGSRWGTMTTTS